MRNVADTASPRNGFFGSVDSPSSNGVHPAAIAQAIQRQRPDIARGLYEPIRHWGKYDDQIELRGTESAFVEFKFYAPVDYLVEYFRSGDEAYLHLYVGERRKVLLNERLSDDEQRSEIDRISEADRDMITNVVGDTLPDAQRRALADTLNVIHQGVVARGSRDMSLLFIGDCLYMDILAFMEADCARHGVRLVNRFGASKNIADQRNKLRELAGEHFDIVFYSPFTYGAALSVKRLFDWRSGLLRKSQVTHMVDQAMREVDETLELIAGLYECPVYVQNTVLIHRTKGGGREALKACATHRIRRLAREQINPRIAQSIGRINGQSYKHLHLIDETPLLKTHSEGQLARYFHWSHIQHPAALSRYLADVYRRSVFVHVKLMQMKVIICDLDDTLWQGTIGEGQVVHDRDRQSILQRLKERGVVLAINSKNDPANVHWNGGVLNEDDFVATYINWDQKVTNMQRIAKQLNLSFNNFLFLDDHPDQREMVKSAIPEIEVFDPNVPETWRLFESWLDALAEQPELDRTRMYRDRQKHRQFIDEQSNTIEDPAAMFSQLGIQLTIRHAAAADLKRVTEIINRTNQFNLCGSRTTFKQVEKWHNSDDTHIIVAESSDKFGSDGTICVAVAEHHADQLHIPVFVLSCRVFGYRMEFAVLNYIHSKLRRPGQTTVGFYTKTGRNQPCENFYTDAGFQPDGDRLVYHEQALAPDATWLTVHCE